MNEPTLDIRHDSSRFSHIFARKKHHCIMIESLGYDELGAMFMHATEGILVADETGTIVRMNPSAEKLFQYTPNEAIGEKIEILIPSRFGNHQDHRANFSKNPHARSMGIGLDLYARRKDGSEFPVEISLSPYTNASGQRFVIAFIVNITLRKEADEKLKHYSIELENQVKNRTLILEEAIEKLEQTKEELSQSLDKEKELNELKSRFVTMASHEFRTPLTTMRTSLSLIAKYAELGELDPQKKYIDKIKTSISNLTDILNDFLSVAKLEEGKIEHQPDYCDFKSALAEIVNEMIPMATSSQRIIYNHEGDESAYVDLRLLKNVMFNLISNAIKFSPEKGLIQVNTKVDPKQVEISISDNGIGISKEDQKHLFERFFRGRNATYIQGTGLGLNIVAKYVELMQGSLNFVSEENKGSTFTLIFPQTIKKQA